MGDQCGRLHLHAAFQLCLSVLVLLPALSLAHSKCVLFNFGDSNSDPGALMTALGLYLGPLSSQQFFQRPTGRFCNGRLYIDFACISGGSIIHFLLFISVGEVGKKLVNSRDGPPKFEQPKMTLEKLLEYGNMLVEEQENVKRVQLADKYMSEAALGDANKDAIDRGSFFGKAAQHGHLPVPEGYTDQNAKNFDPTARSDDGSCLYTF